MGLERLAVVCQDVPSLFDVDTNKAMMEEIAGLSHKRYMENKEHDISFSSLHSEIDYFHLSLTSIACFFPRNDLSCCFM